jgi:hypothetical protein
MDFLVGEGEVYPNPSEYSCRRWAESTYSLYLLTDTSLYTRPVGVPTYLLHPINALLR